MARFQVIPTDPDAVKVWSTKVYLDSRKRSNWDKRTGAEGSSMPVVYKTDLETKAGDEVTTTLIAKLRGKPAEGSNEKLAGRALKLNRATHKMKIDKHRQAVSVGDVMDQKRVNYSIAEQVRDRLADYMAEIYDEQITMTASGSRGIGTEVQHYPLGYGGFPNTFRTPDAAHTMYFDGSRANAAALTANDKLGTNVIDKLALRASKQLGGFPDGNIRMEQISVNGGKYFLYLAAPECIYDLRREVGDAGWLTIEKAKMTAVGNDSPIIKGGMAIYNKVVIDQLETCVKFDTTVAGGSYGVAATRNLFMGANAVAIAHGTRGQRDGQHYELSDAEEDYGEEAIVIVRMIAGFDVTRFAAVDDPTNFFHFGEIVNDLAYTQAS